MPSAQQSSCHAFYLAPSNPCAQKLSCHASRSRPAPLTRRSSRHASHPATFTPSDPLDSSPRFMPSYPRAMHRAQQSSRHASRLAIPRHAMHPAILAPCFTPNDPHVMPLALRSLHHASRPAILTPCLAPSDPHAMLRAQRSSPILAPSEPPPSDPRAHQSSRHASRAMFRAQQSLHHASRPDLAPRPRA